MTAVATFTWDSRSIRLSYTPRWSGVIDHVEIRAEDGQPLPITCTGYKSHFFGPVDPALTMDEIEAMVRAWLDAEACCPAWQDHLLETRQLSLF